MKTYLIVLAIAAAFSVGAYFAGARIAREKCRAEFAVQSAVAGAAAMQQFETTKRIIDAETFNTGGADIRNWLRANCTVAD